MKKRAAGSVSDYHKGRHRQASTVDFRNRALSNQKLGGGTKQSLHSSKNSDSILDSLQQPSQQKTSVVSYHNKLNFSTGKLEQAKPDRALKNKPPVVQKKLTPGRLYKKYKQLYDMKAWEELSRLIKGNSKARACSLQP